MDWILPINFNAQITKLVSDFSQLKSMAFMRKQKAIADKFCIVPVDLSQSWDLVVIPTAVV